MIHTHFNVWTGRSVSELFRSVSRPYNSIGWHGVRVHSPFVRDVVESSAGRVVMIGVDRLDYSKGIALRMEAFDRFLSTYPEWRGKVTYLQITPKSRSEIQEYAEMERQIDETAGRVNGAYGEASWTPNRYVNRAHSRTPLVGLYRSARAALVTPLRDGMNLVAKEYVAAQDREDPGVLILSAPMFRRMGSKARDIRECHRGRGNWIGGSKSAR